MPASEANVELDLNSKTFQANLFALDRDTQRAALETLRKITALTWPEVYRDTGLKWEKIARLTEAETGGAVYSIRLTRSRRATACRAGNMMRFLSIPPDHDATYGRK